MTRKHIFEVLGIGTPLLAGLVSEYFVYLADSAMVGWLGTEYLAAIGIATIFAEILWVIVYPFAPGTQAITSRRFGRQGLIPVRSLQEFSNLSKSTATVLPNALVVSVMAGFFAVGLAAFSREILLLILKDRHLASLAESYIRILKWVMPLGGIFYAFYGFLAAVNLTRPIMVASVGLNFFNIILNYGLVFGNFGLPAMGIQGAAIATVLAETLGTSYLVAYFVFSKKTEIYRCFTWRSFQWGLLKDISKRALPILIQLVLGLSIYLYYESLIADFGTVYLAVTHIILITFLLKRTLVGGFAEGGSILVGNYLGRGDKNEARRYAYAAVYIAALFGVLLCLLIMLFPESIVKIFNRESETVAIGAGALKFFAFFFLVDIMGFPFEIIFTHNGWGGYVLFAESASNISLILGLTLLLTRVFGMGVYAAWFSLALYMVCYACFLSAGFFSNRWLTVKVETKVTK
jgi:MATE family multidrug resistance protein